jgi:NAD(P)-dependent dehydrogenase (short-subunit alcohol dehydrogenase family)
MMDNGLQGKVAWLVGASGTIGRSVAGALARDGAHVVLSSRTQSTLETLAADLAQSTGATTRALPVDLTEREQVDAAARKIHDEFHRIDLLINSTSLSRFGDFLELGDDDWIAVYQNKLFSYLRTIRAVLPYMLDQRDGRIVNISGRGGHQPTLPIHLPGMSANAAVNLLTKGLANRYKADGIRINAVAPGPVVSPRYDAMLSVNERVGKSATHPTAGAPGTTSTAGNQAHPDEIADIVLFLLSDRSRLMTGTVLQADGGSTASL